MKIVLSTHLFLYHDLTDDVLEAIAEAGFDGVEIWAMKPHFPYYDGDAVEAIGKSGERHGIGFPTAHLPMYDMVYPPGQPRDLFGPSSEDAAIRAKWKKEAALAAKMAAQLGAKYFTMHTDLDFPNAGSRFELALGSIESFMKEDLPDGAVLSVENDVGGIEKVEGLLRLIENFDTKRIGVTLDLGHALAGGDVVGAIKAAGKRLNVIHAHDNGGQKDDHLPPGRGVMPWDKVFKALEQVRFKGPFVWEVRDSTRGNDPKLKVLKEILKEIKGFTI